MGNQGIGTRPRTIDYSTRTLLFLFLSILLPFAALSSYVRTEISRRIIEEKEDKLFGLARTLDTYLEGTFNDILEGYGALGAVRETKIEILNRELREITDFVASGNPGVGVGYYDRVLDAIITYGPSSEFQYHVGCSIQEGHQGLDVMDRGQPIVQIGQLVRGNILNCMWPIRRDDEIIGYIWANETVDHVEDQIRPIQNRLLGVSVLILIAIYISVFISTRDLIEAIDHIRAGLDMLARDPAHRIAPVHGSLNRIVDKINDVLTNATFTRIYNKYLLDSVINGVISIGIDGTITWTNKAFHRIVDPDHRATKGCGFSGAFTDELRDLIRTGMYESGRGTLRQVEMRGKTLEVYSNAILDDHNERIGVVFVFRDVTLLKRYEHRLKEKERSAALGELSLHVAHEVKNPLTSIKGFTQLLARDSVPATKRARYARIVDSELNRVNHLLEELLLYGGRATIRAEAIDMVRLAAEIVDRHRSNYRQIRFLLHAAHEIDATVPIDRWKIVQVLDNVILNAVDAVDGRERPTVLVRLTDEGQKLVVTILDNGIGLSAENLERVFQPFFTTKSTGFGFGLSVCYRIIENHHGEITISSKEGWYTALRIVLPRTMEETPAL